MSTQPRRFGGNQEMLFHAEGFHYLLDGTATTVHTAEVLFGVPSAQCLTVINGSSVARTQDRRFVHADAKDWWALTMSGFAFLEMGQLEPVEVGPYFYQKLCPAAREVVGARKRWGIVAAPTATRLHPVSTYGAVLSAFPEVFGVEGIYYPHLELALWENVQYLPDGEAKDRASARVTQLMDEIRSKILGAPQLTFHEYVIWLMQRVMDSPGEGSELTDTVTLFLASRAPEEMYALLNCFLRDYVLLVRLYNEAISSDVCMRQVDAAAGELPYMVHHPAEGGQWWVKESLRITPDAVVVGERSIPFAGEIRSHVDLIAVLRSVFGDHFAVIPKAVCFLTQMLHVATFVNPDECHYELLVKKFIRLMHDAGITFTVCEPVHGRWQQVMHALRAFGDQELVLPSEMALAFGRQCMTGEQLHQVLIGEDAGETVKRLNQLLMACAEADRKQNDRQVIALLEQAGFLPEGAGVRYDVHMGVLNSGDPDFFTAQVNQEKLFDEQEGRFFWRFIDGLPLGSRERSLVLRNLFLSGRVSDMLHPCPRATTLLEQAVAMKRADRHDPRVDEQLECLLMVVRSDALFRQGQYAGQNKGRLCRSGVKSVFGHDVEPPQWFLALLEERDQAVSKYVTAKEEADLRHRTRVRELRVQIRLVVEEAQMVRAKILKALHSLKLVDYYIGPVIGWVLGGDAFIQRIREQIHVVDHPVAPRL